ncbi:MAG: hypothetical protein CL607_04230 [Anaerolineaceae bacterium]|nr:hypothetical protein [Anaerolineaceae bacterium]
MTASQPRTALPTWVDGLWLALCALYILAGVALVPYHGDEPTQIFMGKDTYYVLNGQLDRLYAAPFEALDGDDALEQHLRLINGTLPKSIFGAIGMVMVRSADALSAPWSWGPDWEWNISNGAIAPGDPLLLAARYASALFLAGSVAVLFVIVKTIGGRAPAYLATAYYTLSPAVLINGRRAMMEGPLLFFSLLAVWAALHLLQHRRWLGYVLFGIIGGLTVASKHPGMVTIALLYGALGIITLYQAWQQKNGGYAIRHIWRLFVAGLLTIAVFVAMNPSWWRDPLLAIDLVVQERTHLLEEQTTSLGGTYDLGERTNYFIRQALIAQPMYAEVDFFKPYITEQVAAYEANPWGGIVIGGSPIGAIVLTILAGIGGVMLVYKRTSQATLLLLWALGSIVFVIVSTPLEWQRYYLIAFPALALLASTGLWTPIQAWMGRRA